MKIATVTDLHCGARNDSLVFNEYFLRFWDEVFFPYLDAHPEIKTVFILGDVVDRRKFVNYVVLSSFKKNVIEKLKARGLDVHILVGNHDDPFKNTNHPNAVTELFGNDGFHIYADPEIIELDGTKMLMLPWINVGNIKTVVKLLADKTVPLCWAHLALNGFEMDRGNVCHDGMNMRNFSHYETVFTGHFHHKSEKENIQYLGSPYEMTWADYNDSKGFHVYDTRTKELIRIENPLHMFKKVYYDDRDNKSVIEAHIRLPLDNLQKEYKGCMIKVIVVHKDDPYLFDAFLESINTGEPNDVSVIENDMDIILNADGTPIDENAMPVDDTLTSLNEYIDLIKIGENPDANNRLKTLMREIYVEAINTTNAEV